jgi:hypothetical protein
VPWQARAIVEANNLSANITLIKGRVESVTIPVDKVRGARVTTRSRDVARGTTCRMCPAANAAQRDVPRWRPIISLHATDARHDAWRTAHNIGRVARSEATNRWTGWGTHAVLTG